MITKSYNPSPLEIEMADILKKLQSHINEHLSYSYIENMKINKDKDNPDILIRLKDNDGDPHELVLKIIQRADDHL